MHKKTLLIVDDDALIRRAAERLLRTDFADILTAACVADALRMVEEHGIDQVLSDVMMPGGTGADLHQALPDDLADTMVLMTGGIDCPRAKRYIDGLDNEVLGKPFRAQELRDALKK